MLVDTDKAEIVDYDGEPILMDYLVEQDPRMKEYVDDYKTDLANLKDFVLGKCTVPLEAGICRTRECSFGNMVADAIVLDRAGQYNGSYWTDASIAFVHGSAFLSDIQTQEPHFKITYGDVLKGLERSPLYLVTMTGVQLYKVLEGSIKELRTEGVYLQFSGLEVVVDLSFGEGHRVASISALCTDCPVPRYEIVRLNHKYKVLVTEHLLKGSDGFEVFLRAEEKTRLNIYMTSCLAEYIQKYQTVYPVVENRIRFIYTTGF